MQAITPQQQLLAQSYVEAAEALRNVELQLGVLNQVSQDLGRRHPGALQGFHLEMLQHSWRLVQGLGWAAGQTLVLAPLTAYRKWRIEHEGLSTEEAYSVAVAKDTIA